MLMESLTQKLETRTKLFPEAISDIDKEKLVLIAEEIVGIVEHIRNQFIHKSASTIKREDVFEQYVDDDSVTLQSIAPLLDVTRERIRQLYNNMRKKYRTVFLKLLRQSDDILPELERLCELFEASDHMPLAIAYCGAEKFSKKRLKFTFGLLFGDDFSNALFENLKEYTKIQKSKITTKAEALSAEKRKSILESATFPSPAIIGLYKNVQVYQEAVERVNISFLRKLKKQREIEIIENPDIIYYSSSTTEHRPHFLIRCADGAAILGLIVPVMNMPIFYNVARFNALHSFCKSKGIGYLILDKTGRSIFDIRNGMLPDGLEEDLNTILDSKGEILWSDVKALKETYTVTQEIMAAYILKNKLHFVISPYRIRKIKK